MAKAVKRSMTSRQSSVTTIDDYLRMFPPAVRSRLAQMRQAILAAAPDAVEQISYGMPAFKGRRVLVYFAGYAHHIGLYPGAGAIARFERKIAGLVHAKGSIQFPHEKPLPLGLVKEITRFRVKEDARMIPIKKK